MSEQAKQRPEPCEACPPKGVSEQLPCKLSQHHLKEAFEGTKSELLVSRCPICAHRYDQHDPNWPPPAAAQAAPPIDLAELLQRLLLALEEKKNNEKFFVRFRLWNDARMVGPIGCPLQALYSTARERFPFAHIRLYLLPDPRDFHGRVHISEEDPWQYSNLLRGGNVVLYVWSQEHGHSLPAAPEPEPAVQSSSHSGSTDTQQETFRHHVVELFGDSQDYLTGEKIGGTTPGEAAHIIPVNKTAGAAKTIDDKVLLMAKLEAPVGLYSAENGIPLFPIFHKAFDQFQVSINPDEDYRIYVFGEVPPELRRLDGHLAAGRGKQVIGHQALLRWHFQQAQERQAPRTPAPRTRRVRWRKKRGGHPPGARRGRAMSGRWWREGRG